MADSHGKGVTCGKCICSGKGTVGKEITTICTTIESFSDYIGSTERPHRKHRYGCIGILVFDTECLFQGVKVFGIEDGRQGTAVDSSVFAHGIFAYVASVWHLLSKDYNVHWLQVYWFYIYF